MPTGSRFGLQGYDSSGMVRSVGWTGRARGHSTYDVILGNVFECLVQVFGLPDKDLYKGIEPSLGFVLCRGRIHPHTWWRSLPLPGGNDHIVGRKRNRRERRGKKCYNTGQGMHFETYESRGAEENVKNGEPSFEHSRRFYPPHSERGAHFCPLLGHFREVSSRRIFP